MTFSYQFKETLLTVQDVGLSFGERCVLAGVSAQVRNVTRPDVQQGQVIGILGPSGIGKTQLFRILSGLTRPDRGQVLLGPEQKPVERGAVGVVAQDYPLFAHYNVLDNLRLGAALSGAPSADCEARVRALLERFGLEQHAQQFPCLLSGGQRQRAAIAQQLLRKSPLLLMDEPFSGLDLRLVHRTCALIREVSQHDELLTLVIVSHDIEAILAVADTVWLLGREQPGQPNAPAKIVRELDLKERGIAWEPDVRATAAYAETRRELEARFLEL